MHMCLESINETDAFSDVTLACDDDKLFDAQFLLNFDFKNVMRLPHF